MLLHSPLPPLSLSLSLSQQFHSCHPFSSLPFSLTTRDLFTCSLSLSVCISLFLIHTHIYSLIHSHTSRSSPHPSVYQETLTSLSLSLSLSLWHTHSHIKPVFASHASEPLFFFFLSPLSSTQPILSLSVSYLPPPLFSLLPPPLFSLLLLNHSYLKFIFLLFLHVFLMFLWLFLR